MYSNVTVGEIFSVLVRRRHERVAVEGQVRSFHGTLDPFVVSTVMLDPAGRQHKYPCLELRVPLFFVLETLLA